MRIKDLFRRKRVEDLFVVGARRLERLEEEGRYSCYRNTRATLHKLARYVGGETLPADSVTPAFVEGFRDFLLQKIGNHPNTTTENLKILSLLLDEAGRTDNPCKTIRKGRIETQRNYLLEEELERLMVLGVKKGSEMEVARDLFFVECRTGLRISDLLQLRWQDCADGSIRLRMQKTRQPVTVPMSTSVEQVFARYRGLFSEPAGFVFPLLAAHSRKTGAFSHARALISATGSVNHQIWQLARRAGLEKRISTHTGRHTFATMLISKGASIYDVKELLGHRDIKMTQVYAHLAERRKQELVERLG